MWHILFSKELESGNNAVTTAHKIWDIVWNIGRRRQRDFLNFGGKYSQKIYLKTTREVSAAFFELLRNDWSKDPLPFLCRLL